MTYSNLMHVMGTSWTSNYDGPTNEQLRDPSNWSLAYCDPASSPSSTLSSTWTWLACLPPPPAADRIYLKKADGRSFGGAFFWLTNL